MSTVLRCAMHTVMETGWPISSEMGNSNDDRFVSPTAKAMGHPAFWPA